MTPLFRRFAGDESGATVIEYALIAGIVSIVIGLGLTNVGTETSGLYEFLVANLTPAGAGE